MKWLAIVVVVASAVLAPSAVLAQSAKSSLDDPVQAQRFNEISDHLVCQCGCNMILRVCNHFECPSAIPMRKEIEEQIVAGMTDEAIIAGFVEEYGMVVLSTPPPEGINLAAWVMPGFAILIGLFLIGYFIMDWAAKKKAQHTATPVRVDPEIAARIEAEVTSMEK